MPVPHSVIILNLVVLDQMLQAYIRRSTGKNGPVMFHFSESLKIT